MDKSANGLTKKRHVDGSHDTDTDVYDTTHDMQEASSTLEGPPGLQHMRGTVDASHVAASRSSSSREPAVPLRVSDLHNTFVEEAGRMWRALGQEQQRADRMEKQMLELEEELKELRTLRASEQESATARKRASTCGHMYERADRMEKQMLEFEEELKELRTLRAWEQEESAAAGKRASTCGHMYEKSVLDEALLGFLVRVPC